MRNQTLSLIGGVLIGLTTLAATQGLLAAQESTPRGDEAGMMQMATPAAMDAEMVAKMEQMMDECLAMMKMMSSMMGGEGMQGMMGMAGTPEAAATPGE